MKTAVETFPTNTSSLARCKPGQGSVLTLGYDTARQLYAPNAPSAPKVGVASDIDVASRRFDLEQIERAAWETTPIEYMDKWSKPPFPWAHAVALFWAESVKPPESGLCAGSQCDIVLGIVEGDIVVFGDDGKPTCANRLRIEGPSSALVKIGDKLEDLQRMGVESILQGYFYDATETTPSPRRGASSRRTSRAPHRRGAIRSPSTESAFRLRLANSERWVHVGRCSATAIRSTRARVAHGLPKDEVPVPGHR